MADPNRGRRQLLIVVGGLAATYSLWLAGEVWDGDTTIVRPLAKIAILLGLGAVAFRGFGWARVCLGIWFVSLIWEYGLATILAMAMNTIFGTVMLALTAGVVYGAYVLFLSRDVKAFQIAQRRR